MPRRLLRDEAYEVLAAAIVNGDLRPGAVIRDADLAEQVGLSRTPVREALARLADEGLVESKPNAYTRVTPLDRRASYEAFVILRELHVLATREAVPKMSPGDLDRLRHANADFAAALAAADVDAALAADDAFHSVVVEAAGNRTLHATLDRLTPRIRRLERLRFGSLPGRRSIDMHERIIRACARGDVARACRVVHDNWDTLGRLITTAFDEDDTTTDSST
ncbi:MAG TPA: GntR family transcriptional regulator [Actinomycetes bacterium]|nr:GntR family transcriptional regulator [Actinomycetes bacterium]